MEAHENGIGRFRPVEWRLLPQGFLLPAFRESHSSRIHYGVFGKQGLYVFGKSVARFNSIEPVNDITEMGIKLIWSYLAIGNPSIRETLGEFGLDNYVGIPKAGMMGTNVANDCYAAQPVPHVLELGYHKTTADSLLGGSVVHFAIEFGQGAHRGNFHCFPYGRHGRGIIFPKMLQDVFVFRAIEFLLQTMEITCEHRVTFRQRRFHKPKGPMSFCKQSYHSGTNGDFNLLDSREYEKAQLFVEMIEAKDFGESGAWPEKMLLLVCLHQPPVTCQPKITDSIQCVLGLFFILYLKTSLFENVDLLLKGEQLLGVFHKPISKKWPALVRCIPFGREAVAGSIGCKGTTYI